MIAVAQADRVRQTAPAAIAAQELAREEEKDVQNRDQPHFNVATAIALAGCAFESYNEPAGVVEAYQEWSINGTYTTYVDRSTSTFGISARSLTSTCGHAVVQLPHRCMQPCFT
jgi:hypothetical protein